MPARSSPPVTVRAAGVLPWRRAAAGQGLQVALVHRVRYDDWSWPKGKLDPGEDWATAAAREAWEETGIRVRLGMPLPSSVYPLGRRDGPPVFKRVRYWTARPVGGHGRLEHEIDDVVWLSPAEAADRLSYPRDRVQLEALVEAERGGLLEAWPLIMLRHAKAMPRGSWDRADPLRPLNPVGGRRAARLVPVLTAYTPTRLLCSPSVRCRDTLLPYAVAVGQPLVTKKGLSEEGYAARSDRAHRYLERVVERGEPAALCTHGKLLPDLLNRLAVRADTKRLAASLGRLAESNLDKGEALVCLMVGAGAGARIVSIERHRPPR